MTDLQIIESLLDIVVRQDELIRDLVFELKQQNALSDEIADRLYMTDKEQEDIARELAP
ncbi:MAG: hypothetical protein IKS55_02590 [Oscillospiraceae bacterium]|nr:hypothetical protein [Oscillospiraceae bacterium]